MAHIHIIILFYYQYHILFILNIYIIILFYIINIKLILILLYIHIKISILIINYFILLINTQLRDTQYKDNIIIIFK